MRNLDEFNNWLTLNKETNNTIKTYFNKVKTFFNFNEEFNQESVESYLLSRLNNGVSKATFNVDLNALKSYSEFSNIEINFPKNKTPDKKLQPYLKENDLHEIINKIKFMVGNHEKYSAILSLMFYSGLRIEEIVNLKRTDINMVDESVLVRESKSKQARICPFTNTTISLMKIYFLREREISNAFNTTDGAVRQVVAKIGKMMGYNFQLHPHTFRHSACHFWLKETNNNFNVVQQILGHSDMAITMMYAKISNSEAMEVVQSILKRKKK